MKFKLLLTATMVATSFSAQAVIPAKALQTAANFIKGGSDDSMKVREFFGARSLIEGIEEGDGFRLVRVGKTFKSDFVKQGKVSMLLFRDGDDVADVVSVQLAVKSTDEVADSIKNLPATYAMHGSSGELAERSMQVNGLKTAGLFALKNLVDMGYVRMVDSAGEMVSNIRRINNTPGINANASLDEILLTQPAARRTANGTESVNVGVSFTAEGVPYETYTMQFAFPKNSSVEEVQRVLSVIAESISI